jgi:heterogeneous nuclear ribonucleoprotein L
MVQMGDPLAVERVVSILNNTDLFGSMVEISYSKQSILRNVHDPYQLADGTLSFQDFSGSKNNRFSTPEMASKNRIQPPSKILHFFNTPPGLESKDVEELFTDHGSPAPKCVKLFPSKTERSSSGLIEFETLGDALEALVSCNHQPVPNPNGKFPYIMKLCFSSSRSIPTTIRMPSERMELITTKRMITE